ncbi:hypothetical protein EU805_11080 [Salipiger sp. IMCC34102]|uniref:PilZ domain-containing protein n=1 Tax=Salipiger sp. IMCC34102 TaxID=2510647 RepID=UPI00101BCAEF|nr:PilZ domain-containing protein [Salipiger sp. IMCC34102]RYH02383.1 hypothetical protein EU805_11080 [Salipiger sp. IMCC34102]
MNERFRPRRSPTDYPVKVHRGIGVQQGIIQDVNPNGARLAGLTGLGRSDAVTVEVLSLRFRATVRWCRGDRAGLSFPVPLPPRIVETIRRSTGSPRAGRHSSTGLQELR